LGAAQGPNGEPPGGGTLVDASGWMPAACWMPAGGCRLADAPAGCRLVESGWWMPACGCWMPAGGCRLAESGLPMLDAG